MLRKQQMYVLLVQNTEMNLTTHRKILGDVTREIFTWPQKLNLKR